MDFIVVPEQQKLAQITLPVVAKALRREIAEALYAAGGGHYGGSFSVLDILLALYSRELHLRSIGNPRSRILLSKGHAAIGLYAVLRYFGLCNEPLEKYACLGSGLEGHPDMIANVAVEFSTGSLGQGLSVGLGIAIGLRSSSAHVWVVMGDGECQEGQVWEAAMLASRYRVGNLSAVIDCNRYQEYGWKRSPEIDSEPVPKLAAKWGAFGWQVVECDGHDYADLELAFQRASCVSDMPTLIIAHTIKGYGSDIVKADPERFHCTSVSENEHLEILRSLE
jgi:transketolase